MKRRQNSQNLIVGDEVYGSSIGQWMCASIWHMDACSSPTSTLWGACEGSCLHYEHEGGNFYQYGAAREVDMTPILNVGGAFLLTFDVMVVWTPNSTASAAPPASSVRYWSSVANTNDIQWVPVYTTAQSTPGTFTTITHNSFLPSTANLSSSWMVDLGFDNGAPSGPGVYQVWLDKISLFPWIASSSPSVPSSTPAIVASGSTSSYTASTDSTRISSSATTVSSAHSLTSLVTITTSGSVVISETTIVEIPAISTQSLSSVTLDPTSSNHISLAPAAIAGIVIAVVALLASMMVLYFMWRKISRASKAPDVDAPYLSSYRSDIHLTENMGGMTKHPLTASTNSPLTSHPPKSGLPAQNPANLDLPPDYRTLGFPTKVGRA